MTSMRTDLIIRQDLSVTGTLMTSTRTDLIDHRDPGELQDLDDQVT